MTDLLVVVGARPNFMKAAPVVDAAESVGLSCSIVHTGQHYDSALSAVFFEELGLPEPDVYLGVGSASHASQTAEIMLRFEPELLRIDPGAVVVVGDVNSTLACALVAVKEHYPVVHVEAGLRCNDLRMAEEINRRLTDRLSVALFTTSRDADENLLAEGIGPAGVFFVGNTMIDTLLRFREIARERQTAKGMGLDPGGYAVATLHRPENVDHPERLRGLLRSLGEVAQRIPVVFPLHPRTAVRVNNLGLDGLLEVPGLVVSTPAGYVDFMSLLGDAGLVITDSGGVQEETTVLGIPCLTVRDSTERPVTVTQGTNRVIGASPTRIVSEVNKIVCGDRKPGRVPELWDGRAGERIATLLRDQVLANEAAAESRA